MEVETKLVITAINNKERLNPYIVYSIPTTILDGSKNSLDIACDMLEKITGIKAYKDGQRQGWTLVEFCGIVETAEVLCLVYSTILPEKVELIVKEYDWLPLNEMTKINSDDIPILRQVI